MRKETANNKGSKSIIYIIGAIIILGTTALAIYTFKNHQDYPAPSKLLPDSSDTWSNRPPADKKADSLPEANALAPPTNAPIAQGSENESLSPYRIIGHAENLTSQNLPFGKKVWVDNNQSDEAFKAVVLGSPGNQQSRSLLKLNADMLIEEYRFEKYKTNFSLAPFAKLSSGVKKILLDDNYSDGNSYSLAQNLARAKSSVAFGDFDGDGMEDVAVIMDNNENQISRLLILCINEVTQQPYVAFAENYTDKMRVRSFQKDAKIYMDTEKFVPAPRAGIIVTAEDIVLAIVYDVRAQKFKTYLQE